jgi:hypothetical protein
MDLNAEGIDLYNTMLRAMDAGTPLGPAEREHHAIDQIRA